MIQIRGVTKTYGDSVAVEDLSFDVRPGRITGFLGPNGSGKSTTMRMILGLDRPDTGTVRINGGDYTELARPLTEVGALLEARSMHPGRSAADHLRFLADSNGIPGARVDRVLEIVGLESVADRRAGSFSLGMGQRLGIAAALLGDPPVLVFDEPVNGLDPEGIIWVRRLLRGFAAEGRTILVSSHLMTEMALTADRLVVIGRGRLIADTTVSQFVGSAGGARVAVRAVDPQRLRAAIDRAGGTVTDGPDDALLVAGLTAAEVGECALAERVALTQLTAQLPSLEEAFMSSTSSSVVYHGAVGGSEPLAAEPAVSPAPAVTATAELSAPEPPAPRQPARLGADLRHYVRAEWRKFFSLRSSRAALLATFVVCVAFGGIAGYGTVARWDDLSVFRRAFFDAAALGVGGIFFGQLVLGALGVLAMSGEYSTGTIRATLAAAPRRTRVLAAKVFVFAVVALVVSLVTTVTAFLVTQWTLTPIGVDTTLTAPDVPRSVIGAALFLVAVGLLGLGLATIVRHTAGAISTLFGILLVLPLMVRFLPDDWAAEINPYLPLNAGIAVTQVIPVLPGLPPWQSLGLVFLYAAGALVIGAVVLQRRDA